MRRLNRRRFLGAVGASASAATYPARGQAAPAETRSFDNAAAKLYDATRCIGCRSCLRACRVANDLPPDRVDIQGIDFDLPQRLTADNWMVIQAYRPEGESATNDESRQWSFIKKSCMHCNLPACASACPVAALTKTEAGPVRYEAQRCIGCRYCLLACPFQVPRYEWVERMPRIRKCNLNLACVHACPVGALETGSRRDLIAEAHQRIRQAPDRYVDHVYGEHEAGGTSFLIVSGVPFEELGLPTLPPMVRSRYAEAILDTLPGLVIGMGLFLGGLHQLEKRRRKAGQTTAEPDEEHAL